MKPLVSIITVVLNAEATIQQTIDSVKNQTYPNIEYIILDGKSVDGTVDIIKKNSKCVDVFVSEEDDGLYDAMNKGIQMAHGDIIGIINSDDYYEPDAVEKVVNYFNNSDYDVVYGRVYEIDSEGKKREDVLFPEYAIWYQMSISHPAVFVKKSIYITEGVFDTTYKIAADYDFVLRLYSKGAKFGFVNEFLAYFRLDGLSRKKADLTDREMLDIAYKYFEHCDCKDKVSPILREKKMWVDFAQLIQNSPEVFVEYIERYMVSSNHELIIFGTGRYGDCCYVALKDSPIKIKCFWDNNRAGQRFHELPVNLPELKSDRERDVLLALRLNYEEVEKQINKYENINCINLYRVLCDMYER